MGEVIATSRPAKRVHQRRLADIGRPGDHDGKAVSQALGGIGSRERPVDPLDCGARRASHRFEREIRGVLDIGEIDLRFDRRHGLEQAYPNRFALAAQRPAGDVLGLSPLRLRFRFDQIGEPVHFGKIDLPVHESAPGEFPGLREAEPRNERERFDTGRGDGSPAGDADLRHLLAGEAARRLKPGDQRPVERLPRLRMSQRSQDSATIRKFGSWRHCLQRFRTSGTGYAHYGDRGSAGAGCGREDRVVIVGEHGR